MGAGGNEIDDAIRAEWGPVEVAPAPTRLYLLTGLWGGLVLALVVPAAVGAIAGGGAGGWRNGILGAGTMFGFALLAFLTTGPAGAVLGVATGAAALFARGFVAEGSIWLRLPVIVAVAAAVSAAGAWLTALTVIPLFAEIASTFAVSGGVGGGLLGALAERSVSRRATNSDR